MLQTRNKPGSSGAKNSCRSKMTLTIRTPPKPHLTKLNLSTKPLTSLRLNNGIFVYFVTITTLSLVLSLNYFVPPSANQHYFAEAARRQTIYTLAPASGDSTHDNYDHQHHNHHHHHHLKQFQNAKAWNRRQLTARQLVLDTTADNEQHHMTNSHALAPLRDYDQQQQPDFQLVDRWPPRTSSVRATKTRRTSSSSSSGGKGTKGGQGARRQQQPQNHVKGYSPPAPTDGAFVNNSNTTTTTTTRRQVTQSKRKNIVCYYGSWAVYRPDAGKFSVEDIDPFVCTHVIYGFTGLSFDNLIKPLDPWNDLEDNYGKGAMKRFTNLKLKNPDLKTLVAIGGWNEGSIKYSKMASEPEARKKFVSSVVNFLKQYNFDGLDLDWEYPGSRGGASYDKRNFVTLLRELSEAFKPHGHLLTAAVSAGKAFMDPAYDVAEVSRYLDLINLMAYDYHGGWEPKTGMNAPLFSSPQHDLSLEDKQLNVNWSINYWLSQGAAREKLMLGVGSYGRSFTLDRESEHGLNAPASQKGRAGPYTREPGSLGYNEICQQLQQSSNSNNNHWTVVRDPDYLAPYAYTNNGDRQWVGYDDMESLALKAQLAKSMGLGGVMMWSIETDDFRGYCHGGEKFPLLKTIRRVLDNDAGGSAVRPPSSSTTRRPNRPTTTTTTSTTTTTPGHEVEEQQPASSTKRPLQPSSTTARPRPPIGGTSTKKPPVPTWTTSTSTTTTTTTTKRPISTGGGSGGSGSAQFQCSADGMFADPANCRKFYRCLGTGTPFAQRFSFDCGPGTAFQEQIQACDHIYNVQACSSSSPAAAAAAAPASSTSSVQIVTTRNAAAAATTGLIGRPPLLIVPAPLVPSHLMLARHFYPTASAAGHFQFGGGLSPLRPAAGLLHTTAAAGPMFHWRR